MTEVDRPATLRHSCSSPNVRRSLQKPSDYPQAEESLALLLKDLDSRNTPHDSLDSRVEYYACNVCFEVASNPILTACGHLFDWECLYQWLSLPSQLACPVCPVCKSACDIPSLTPIYGRGGACESSADQKLRTLSTSSQTRSKNLLDQWLEPHIHPPSVPLLGGATPARPAARRRPPVIQKKPNLYPTTTPPTSNSIFGNTHPVVIFSAGITTLCGMQILNNGGFTAPGEFSAQDDNTSKMMWILGLAIVAGVWFH